MGTRPPRRLFRRRRVSATAWSACASAPSWPEPPWRLDLRGRMARRGAGRDMTQDKATNLRVVVVDDQTVVREGLVTILGLLAGVEVVAAGGDGNEAVALVELH